MYSAAMDVPFSAGPDECAACDVSNSTVKMATVDCIPTKFRCVSTCLHGVIFNNIHSHHLENLCGIAFLCNKVA